MTEHKQNQFIHFAGLMMGSLVLVLAIGLTDVAFDWPMLTVVIISSAMVGFTLGIAIVKHQIMQDREDSSIEAYSQQKIVADQTQSIAQHKQTKSNDYLRQIIDELCQMQASHDLLYRYQCLTRMAEKVLDHTLGPCSVSLWCPDSEQHNLIECVIKPSYQEPTPTCDAFNEIIDGRKPCRIPLNVSGIIQALKTEQPYLGVGSKDGRNAEKQNESLHCDACIPLYREYGQPLLINIEFTPQAEDHFGQRKHSIREGFDTAVNLINMVWTQLQATNQRQWMIEHDPHSRVLRAESFIQQANRQANIAVNQDELFSVIVLTVRGFRGMFAGNSQQWNQLSALFGRCLKSVITQKSEDFLMGKMADDVFAIYLPRTDEFLARSMMQNLQDKLTTEMNSDTSLSSLDIKAVDIQWSLADQKQFQGRIDQLLDDQYNQLFRHDSTTEKQAYRIYLEENTTTKTTC